MARLALAVAMLALCASSAMANGKGLSMPNITLPSKPDIKMPNFTMPDIKMPNITIPDIKFTVPDIKMPNITMPSIPKPSIDIDEAACQKVCAPKCTVTLNKNCTTVPVTKKSCKHVTGTSTKKVCHKKCTVGLDVSKKTVTASLSAGANKAASTSSSATATAAAATPAVTVKADTDGRRRLLNGKGASLPSLPSMGKGPVSVSVSVPEIKPDVDCKDECQDVSFPTLELKCEDVTTQQESCTVVPKQTCTEQCMCVPMKKVSISLDKKN